MSRQSGGGQTSPATVAALAADAMALCGGRRAILGITGNPGAGKSTLAALLCRHIAQHWGADAVALVPMDGFHLADTQLRRLGLLDRKGAPETFDARGYAHLLNRIRHDVENDVYAPGFDRSLEQPLAAAVVVPPTARLVVTEGNYLLHPDPPWPDARLSLDSVWFVTVDDQTRRQRLIARHVEFGKTPQQARDWVAAVDDPNAEQVRLTAAAADRVIVNGVAAWSPSV
ncbi:nucleoside/nucleotide kinase family protein [Mycobacterium sp. SMC-4]|uniref:nucleoside/nucleotide kinase family protein n=1 Tax=Mycobacterium sp. SMC-4 TaxID=2857059 RepID=UPI003D033445